MPEPRDLILISQARQSLAKARTLDEVKAVRDKAQAIRMYAKAQGESLEVQNCAAEVKLRAERRAGELLAEMEKNAGGPVRRHAVTAPPPKLADIGIAKKQAERWQQVATVPEIAFERHLAEHIVAKKELTTASVLSLAKSLNNKKRNGHTLARARASSTSALDSLIAAGEKFGTIYADPPWQYGNQSTRAATDNHYPTMTLEALAALPVSQLAADDAHLHLWTTNAFLRDSFDILDAWGFEYRSVFVWAKPQMGIGNYWRVSHEFLMLGIRGDAKSFADHSLKSWAELDRTAHSTKPEAVRKLIEKASPGPRLEMFGRRLSDGWTVWGNQIERTMYDTEAVA